MDRMDPLDAAMMTAELVSNPMHVARVLILSPPADAGPAMSTTCTGRRSPQTIRSIRGFADTRIVAVDTGGMWVWRELTTST